MGLFDRFKKPKASSGDPRVPALVGQLQDPDWQARVRACEELERLGAAAESALSPLEDNLSDERNEVCEAAARAVNRIRDALARKSV
jgi:HEAT repeat protein